MSNIMQSNLGRRRALTLLTGIALLPFAIAGCGGPSDNSGGDTGANLSTPSTTTPNVGGASVHLTGQGATFPYPIYSKWFTQYAQTGGAQVNYQGTGSGAGIKQLKAQTVDFAGSDVPLSAKDKGDAPGPLVQMPTVAGAVAIVYNLPNAKTGLKLSGDVVANIYLGKIKTWNDPAITALNPGVTLPSTAIAVAHRSDGSGTTNIFTSYLSAVSPAWKSSVGAGKSVEWPTGQGGAKNDGVAAIVKQQPGGIGYVELAYAKTNNLNYAAIKNAKGEFVTPDVASTEAAAEGGAAALAKDITTPIVNSNAPKAYPIAGFTYIMTYQKPKDATKGAALVKLFGWMMDDAQQKQAATLDYAPLPQAVRDLNAKTIATIGK